MLKNVTIRLSEQAARWVRRKAADEDTSVSKLVGGMIERQMRRTEAYGEAHARWRKDVARARASALAGMTQRATREEIYDRHAGEPAFPLRHANLVPLR